MSRALFCTSAATGVLAIQCLISAAAVPGGQRQARPPAAVIRPDESVLVSVLASAPWTDTGVLVNDGDQISIRAWGSVRYADGRDGAGATVSGPAGMGPAAGCGYVVGDTTVPAEALIANVAPQMTLDGAGFLVGAGRTFTLPVESASARSGRLFLGINHGAVLCDRSGFDSWRFRNSGSGAYTVQFTIRRRR